MTVIVSCRQAPKLRNHAANNVPGQSVLLCYAIIPLLHSLINPMSTSKLVAVTFNLALSF